MCIVDNKPTHMPPHTLNRHLHTNPPRPPPPRSLSRPRGSRLLLALTVTPSHTFDTPSSTPPPTTSRRSPSAAASRTSLHFPLASLQPQYVSTRFLRSPLQATHAPRFCVPPLSPPICRLDLAASRADHPHTISSDLAPPPRLHLQQHTLPPTYHPHIPSRNLPPPPAHRA